MKRVLERLKCYAENINLSRYNWDFDDSFLKTISDLQPNFSTHYKNVFERNVALKFMLTEYFQTNPSGVDNLNFWIIQDWGGIKRFKNTPENINKIDIFNKELEQGKLSRNSFTTISSLSKLGSFWDCRNYAIYDSRVIYSLNWLILKYSQVKKFFPTPSGRNSIMVNYNIDTIIQLFRIQSKQDVIRFYSKQETYHEYCSLMKHWSSEIWIDDNRKKYPFYLEMLLFCISVKEIIEDIKQSIRWEICE
jgi:hypothetical protein